MIGARAVIGGTGSSLYLDRASNPHRALVVCSGTGQTLAESHGALCALNAAAQQGVQWLQARNRSSETDQGAVLIDRLQDLADAVRTRIDCS
jgi:thiamine monophosphate synthase